MPSAFPSWNDAKPRLHNGIIEFPVHYMRGGTSTGVVIHKGLAPEDESLREELARHLMGVPLEGELKGNKQTTGLGRGPATSNKVFFAHVETLGGEPRIVSTLAQLAADTSQVDWSVNCGNMSAALPFWALDTGLAAPEPGASAFEIDIFNTNTGVVISSRISYEADGRFSLGEIPGVNGRFPAVDLILIDPVGAKTGKLLPTGNAVDQIGSFRVSCVDVAVPMVIARASDFGKTGHESVGELEADTQFKTALRTLWVEAGLRMGLRTRNGELMSAEQLARSETIPKVCIIGEPRHGGALSVRYFTPQTGHASLAVTGGCCLAACTLIEGSVAQGLTEGLKPASSVLEEHRVGIENPAGMLMTSVTARVDAKGTVEISRAAYQRSAQILMRGHVPLYRASSSLKAALHSLACPLKFSNRIGQAG